MTEIQREREKERKNKETERGRREGGKERERCQTLPLFLGGNLEIVQTRSLRNTFKISLPVHILLLSDELGNTQRKNGTSKKRNSSIVHKFFVVPREGNF